MKNRVTETLARALQIARAHVPSSDRDLLTRYAESGDQTAFATVVSRHAATVLGVCRRVLHSQADAEDACQAVFLILARRVGTVRWQASAANWLYTTARKVALNASKAAARRARRELQAAVPEEFCDVDQMTGRELLAALDEELERLPPRYREPLVLCYLQGLTRDEAAQRLGLPPATLKTQLERGRRKLAEALTRRGIVLGAALLTTAATSAAGAASPQLLESILAAAGGSPSPAVAALAQEVLMNGVFAKTKWLLLALLVLGMTGFGFTAMPTAAGPPGRLTQQRWQFVDCDKGEDKPEPEVKERTLSGKVLGADGKPIGAELALVWIGGKTQPLGRTNPDGTFRIVVPLKHAGRGGWLVARAPGHGMDFQPNGIDNLPESLTPTAEITLKLPRARPIQGRVLDQQGKPVAGASVVPRGFSTAESDDRMDACLQWWAIEPNRGGRPPEGERGMWFSNEPGDIGPARSPYTVSTDRDGRFEIAEAGAGQLVDLVIRAPGLADQDIAVLNRAGFKPDQLKNLARIHEVKGFSFAGKWQLYGPDPVIVVEAEKIIRGTVTGPDGKPRAGVRVAFTRTNPSDLSSDHNPAQAVTDKDGRYVIQGARKHKGYMVECPSDPKAGLLPCKGFVEDTAGYEPITIDLKCVRGVVLTGIVKNKATGKPVDARLSVDVLNNNPFVKQFPTFPTEAALTATEFKASGGERFRVVTIPGPVILMATTNGLEGFKPVAADPGYPQYFLQNSAALPLPPQAPRLAVDLQFYGYAGGPRLVKGCWCKILEPKETDTEVTVNVELEPATRQSVKVVDASGRPVTGARATGLTHINLANAESFPDTDTLTVLNVDPKAGRLVAAVHEKRKLVGTVTVKADQKDVVLNLGPGGKVTGRAVDSNGRPLAGLKVSVVFDHREVGNAFKALNKVEQLTTDADGRFRIDTLFPGQEFRLFFQKGQKRFGPDLGMAPKHTVARDNDTLDLGELKLDAAQGGEEGGPRPPTPVPG